MLARVLLLIGLIAASSLALILALDKVAASSDFATSGLMLNGVAMAVTALVAMLGLSGVLVFMHAARNEAVADTSSPRTGLNRPHLRLELSVESLSVRTAMFGFTLIGVFVAQLLLSNAYGDLNATSYLMELLTGPGAAVLLGYSMIGGAMAALFCGLGIATVATVLTALKMMFRWLGRAAIVILPTERIVEMRSLIAASQRIGRAPPATA
jgi:hypothetical protein